MARIHNPPVPPDDAPDQRDEPVPEGPPEDDEDGQLRWRPEFRSMLDHPKHPLHHLKDA
jgi:hypothetical protein